jgi:beta-phosphoglucomutase-like phosphatase (HAD superfamily)
MSDTSVSLVAPHSGAIFFDVDGTLADTDPLHSKAWQLVAESSFGLTFTWADYHEACILGELSPTEFLMQLGIDARPAKIQNAKAAIFRRLLQSESSLAPGALTFLDSIRQADITIALVSGGSRSSVEAFLETLWPGGPPALSVSREDTSHHKPHPEPYLFAIGQLELSASDCLAIEDTKRGIQSAHDAGLQSIKVGCDSIDSIRADLTVPSLADLSARPDGRGGLLIRKAEF